MQSKTTVRMTVLTTRSVTTGLTMTVDYPRRADFRPGQQIEVLRDLRDKHDAEIAGHPAKRKGDIFAPVLIDLAYLAVMATALTVTLRRHLERHRRTHTSAEGSA